MIAVVRSATLVEMLSSRRDAAGTARAMRVAAVLFITALTAAAAQISIPLPFTPVPLTLQPTIVLLGGFVLGSRLGAASQCLYLAAGIAGLPVFAASGTLPPGAWRLLGPTGGYLMAYPLAAWVAGSFARRGFDRRYLTSVLGMALGLVVIYACGTTWLAYFAIDGKVAAGFTAAFASGVAPFITADLVKLVAAAGVVPGLWRLLTPSARDPHS